MVSAEGRVATASAIRYAKQLCHHATRMGATATWAGPHGTINFPQGGSCRLTATDTELSITADAPTVEQLIAIQTVITANVERFGQRPQLTLEWSPDAGTPINPDSPRAPARRDSHNSSH